MPLAPSPEAPAPEIAPKSTLTGPVLLRRALLVLVTALLVARPLVLGEDPGLIDNLSDPLGMVLTMLWLVAAAGWAVWRFWLRPTSEKHSVSDASQKRSTPQRFYEA